MQEAEAELRGIGVALGAGATRVAATPTGVVVSLGSPDGPAPGRAQPQPVLLPQLGQV